MKIKVITSYKPGTWEQYSRKGIESMAEQFPKEIDIVVYAEEPKPKCSMCELNSMYYCNMNDQYFQLC